MAEKERTLSASIIKSLPGIFYFFDDKLDLVYRGQMDDSRPGNNKDVTGEDLIIAFENLLAGEAQEEIQRPSMGCNIKWK